MAIKIISTNRKVSFNYFIDSCTEAGISLLGSEIKSLRINGATLTDSYVIFKNYEAYIINMHISTYDKANINNHDPIRNRKLLMHKKEIIKLKSLLETKNYFLIPTKIYFNKGLVKVEVALCRPKKKFDKREAIKKRDIARELEKNIRKSS